MYPLIQFITIKISIKMTFWTPCLGIKKHLQFSKYLVGMYFSVLPTF